MSGSVMSKWCKEDVLPLVGKGRGLARYPGETADSYRARIHGAWDTWDYAGAAGSMINQIQAAGFGRIPVSDGMWIYEAHVRPHSYTAWVMGYASEFSILLPTADPLAPELACPKAGVGTKCGSVICGTGLSREQVQFLSELVRKFRPSKDLCRAIVFKSGGVVSDRKIIPTWCPRY